MIFKDIDNRIFDRVCNAIWDRAWDNYWPHRFCLDDLEEAVTQRFRGRIFQRLENVK